MVTKTVLATNNLQNILFCVPQNKKVMQILNVMRVSKC